MKQITIPLLLLTLLFVGVNVEAVEQVEKYWERTCGVPSTGDDVSSMAVWESGDILATVSKSGYISLFNATTGLMEEIVEELNMSGVGSVCAGDFSEDGAFFACTLSAAPGSDLEVYYWATTGSAPLKILDQAYSNRLGDAIDVIGEVSDNSVVILIGGNSGTSQPVKITKTSSNWPSSTLANVVQVQDIDQVVGGKFYATYAGGDIVRYNADGSVDAVVVSGAGDLTGIAIDETQGFIYAMGYESVSSNYLKVYEISSGNTLAISSDALDANNATSSNGSSDVEIMEYAGGTYIFALSENNGCARYSYSTVVTVGSGCDYSAIQDAIEDYSDGGSLTGVAKPLVISINPSSGPYDEVLGIVEDATGDITGDVVLKSSSALSKVVVKIQKGNFDSVIEGGDGLCISQSVYNVILKNLVLCPSLNNAYGDDMFLVYENSSNTTINWVEMYGCILTDINSSGDPMITSAANALDEPGDSGSAATVDGDTLFRFGGSTTSFSQSFFGEQTVIYGCEHMNYVYLHGEPCQFRLHNSIIAHNRTAGIFASGYDADGSKLIITGDDQTDGILSGNNINCSAIYDFNRRLFYDYCAGIHTRNSVNELILVVKNTIIRTEQDHDSPYNLQSRGISSFASNDVPATPQGRNTNMYKIHDVIIDVPDEAIIHESADPVDLQRITIMSPFYGFRLTDEGTETVNIKDSVFANCSTVIGKDDGDSGNFVLTNCALPQAGDYAITDVTGGEVNFSLVDCIYDDPDFLSIDPLSKSYMDIDVEAYRYAGSGSSPLAGGADFILPPPTPTPSSSVDIWEIYK